MAARAASTSTRARRIWSPRRAFQQDLQPSARKSTCALPARDDHRRPSRRGRRQYRQSRRSSRRRRRRRRGRRACCAPSSSSSNATRRRPKTSSSRPTATMTRALNGLPLDHPHARYRRRQSRAVSAAAEGRQSIPRRARHPALPAQARAVPAAAPRHLPRVASTGPVKIMFPMIATLEDLRAAKAVAEQVRAELGVAAGRDRHHGRSAVGRAAWPRSSRRSATSSPSAPTISRNMCWRWTACTRCWPSRSTACIPLCCG